jgi:hypothetical protein
MEMQEKLNRTPHRTSAAFPPNPKKDDNTEQREAARTGESTHKTHKHTGIQIALAMAIE